MTLAVVHTGLVSPFGLTPQDHVFFLRAGAALPPPSPFVLADADRTLDAYACPWLDLDLPTVDRLVALAEDATLAATDPDAPKGPTLMLCASGERPGLSADDVMQLEQHLKVRIGAKESVRLAVGEAGFFGAIRGAIARADAKQTVVIAGVDSLISLSWVAHRLERAAGPWSSTPLAWSEGAGVVYLQSAARAREERRRVIGTVLSSATQRGVASDENDEPVDGAAMSALFSSLGVTRVFHAFGQAGVDTLRSREWSMMTARKADQFREGSPFDGVEQLVGRVGAAAGAMDFVYGMTLLHHRASDFDEHARDPFLSWAISPDGMRGIAAAVVSDGS